MCLLKIFEKLDGVAVLVLAISIISGTKTQISREVRTTGRTFPPLMLALHVL
jgi:hypothetical protein